MARQRTKLPTVDPLPTPFSRVIDAIVKKPFLPNEPINGYLEHMTDEAIRNYYKELHAKWSSVIAAKPLSLERFAELARDYFGDAFLNKDKVNRIKYIGVPEMGNSSINPEALKRFAALSQKYSYYDLQRLAQESLSRKHNTQEEYEPEPQRNSVQYVQHNNTSNGTSGEINSKINSDINNVKGDRIYEKQENYEYKEYKTRKPESNSSTHIAVLDKPTTTIQRKTMSKTLAEYVSAYVTEHGLEALQSRGFSAEEIIRLMAGELPMKKSVIALQDIFNLSSEEILDLIGNSFFGKTKA